ncbi:hypothetical protein FRC02_007910 [Tulasnella sp. 418]|nr:hypothetical protein FRC02_007910 [Tulasnella sp. 418]
MTMPHLQQLEIIGFSKLVVHLIRDVLPMPKETLRLQLIVDPFPAKDQALSPLMSSIGSLAPPTLKNVEICYACFIPLPYQSYDSRIRYAMSLGDRTGCTIGLDMVRSIFRQEQLEKLILNLKTPVEISKEEIRGLIRGLPHPASP